MSNTSLVPDARGIVVIRVRRHDSFRTSISLDETILRLALCIWKTQSGFNEWLYLTVRRLDAQLQACSAAGLPPARESGFSRRVRELIIAEAIQRLEGPEAAVAAPAPTVHAKQLQLPGLVISELATNEDVLAHGEISHPPSYS
ncbi:hypothetical protein [Acidovorax sp.]|uniref:hypothetical protein n=1 Tax=Acidovorax sp. TaxID=1872122 RepID=UPI0027BA71C1|nr:hypothetical protein [Acidovorax sp.]